MSHTVVTKFEQFTSMDVLVKAFESKGWTVPALNQVSPNIWNEQPGTRLAHPPTGQYALPVRLVPVTETKIELRYDSDFTSIYEESLGQKFDLLKEAYAIENTREFVQLKGGSMTTENLTNGVVRATLEIEVYV